MGLSIIVPPKLLFVEIIIIMFLTVYNIFFVSIPSSWYLLVTVHVLFLLLAFYLIKENIGAEKTIREAYLLAINRSQFSIYYSKLVVATLSFIIVPMLVSSFMINFFFGLDRIIMYRIIIFILLNLFVVEVIILLHLFRIDYIYQFMVLLIYEMLGNLYSSIGVLVIGSTSNLGLLQNALCFYILADTVLYVLTMVKGWLMR